MRLKITLRPCQDNMLLTWHYQYPLQSAVYRVIEAAEPVYADLVHHDAYVLDKSRRTKMFCFSRLHVPRTRISSQGLYVDTSQTLSFYLASPLSESSITNTILGLFRASYISLGDRLTPPAHFKVESVEPLEEPEIGDSVKAKLLSPVISSVQRPDLSIEYLSALDRRLPDQIRRNLLLKHEALHGYMPANTELYFKVDREYVYKKGGQHSRQVTTYQEVKRGTSGQVNLRGFLAPFTLEGNPDLIRTAYDCGIGEKNSLGFGMWDVVSPNGWWPGMDSDSDH